LAENPLLPNRRLKELLELMRRSRKLDGGNGREAMLAATAIHLEEGDLLVGTASDKAATALAPKPKANPRVTWDSVLEPEDNVALPKLPRLTLAAAMAVGQRATGAGNIVLSFAAAGAKEEGFAEALTYAQKSLAPLLVSISDDTSGKTKKGTLSYSETLRLAKKLQVPLFPVDGEDAVAVYRVMQECTLRARNGEGPALLWCVMAQRAAGSMTRSQTPIARLEKYLAVRNIT
jgi:hypothetical protein